MKYLEFFLQPDWVLQSASRNLSLSSSQLLSQPSSEHEALINAINELHWDTYATKAANVKALLAKYPSNLILNRLINQLFSSQLPENVYEPQTGTCLPKIAIIIPGELRCLHSSFNFFSSLGQFADIFICTNKEFADEALSLSRNVYIIDKEPELEVASMQQWHKLYVCLLQVKRQEIINQSNYDYILKLRTDYYFVKPESLLEDLANANGRIISSSDKIFGSSRDIMMLFESFYFSLLNTFFNASFGHLGFNLQQIINSDDSFKWYGFDFPTNIFGSPNSVEKLRQNIKSIVLSNPNQPLESSQSTESNISFFKGHPTFPSEICFARYVNFLGIPVKSSVSFQGFLREDRFK